MATTLLSLVLFPLMAIKAFMNKYKSGEEEEFFNIRQTTTIKGIMMMLVFFHHYSHIVDYPEIIEYAYRICQVCMTVFFFISGYATYLGHSKAAKIDLKKIWIKRAWRLYLPIMIFSVMFNNFMDALLVFMLATDLAFIFFKTNKNRLLFISAINVLYFVVIIAAGLPEYWYDDILTYALGAAFAVYKDSIVELMKNKKLYFGTLIALGAISAPCMYLAINYVYYDITVTIFSFFECIMVVLLMMKLNVKSNIFYFIGQYTWEIFMSHQMFITLFNNIFEHNIFVMVCSFAASIVFSILVQGGVKKLRTMLSAKANG